MSRSKKSRTPENFPRMKQRAKGRMHAAGRGGAALGMTNPNRRKSAQQDSA